MMQRYMIPNQICAFLQYLESVGFQAYLVGGCVRDVLLKIEPHDWDVCTDAQPQEIQTLFPDAMTYGVRHGTVTVKWQEYHIEVTTFRSEGHYTDHRRPDQVQFIHDLKTDLSRRDFTINAIAMDACGVLHDPFDGMDDLQTGIIKAVGRAERRFEEDALRMFRAFRFSAQLGFKIEANTKKAILKCAPLSKALSAERIAQELEKTLLTKNPELCSEMVAAGLLRHLEIHQVSDNASKLRAIVPDRIQRWCGFCLLIGQTAFLKQLRLDRRTIELCEICESIRHNPERDIRFWKQAIHHYGMERAAVSAQILSAWDSTDDSQKIKNIALSGDCCTTADLAVGGSDLKELGLRGKEIGAAMDAALCFVWDHPEENERERLLRFLREEIHHG